VKRRPPDGAIFGLGLVLCASALLLTAWLLGPNPHRLRAGLTAAVALAGAIQVWISRPRPNV
jgi:hypothetical protein